MRPDLFHRLAMCRLYVPPLRERPEDIVPLAEHFLATDGCAGAAALRAHCWPGNVRELQGVVYALSIFVEAERLSAADVERELQSASTAATERARLTAALEAHGWNATVAARALGVGRTKLYQLIRRHGVQRPTLAALPSLAVRTDCSAGVRARTLFPGGAES